MCFPSDAEDSDAEIIDDSGDDSEVDIAESVDDEDSDDELPENFDLFSTGNEEFAAPGTISRSSDQFYLGKNNRKWWKEPKGPTNVRTPASHIFKGRRGTSNESKSASLFEMFNMIISPELKTLIIRCTNSKASAFYATWNKEHPDNQKSWKPLTMDELNCFIGEQKPFRGLREDYEGSRGVQDEGRRGR